jgi:hypothetical protein
MLLLVLLNGDTNPSSSADNPKVGNGTNERRGQRPRTQYPINLIINPMQVISWLIL